MSFSFRGFNLVESVLRHTPEQLRRFIRRMKTLGFNSLIVQYDYGFRRHQKLICEECDAAGIEIRLMVFGPRTFFRLAGGTAELFAKDENGAPFFTEPVCESWPCVFAPRVLDTFAAGCAEFLRGLPSPIRIVQMRSGDGLYSCRCPRCRNLTVSESWLPFVKSFVDTAHRLRPELRLEADLYIRRYEIPSDPAILHELDFLMYDTFFRQAQTPLGQHSANTGAMRTALDGPPPPGSSPNEYHAEQLRRWSAKFPGKIYIHENAMLQSYHGVFQHNTGTMLADLEFYRQLGIAGVVYEAYEPGYENFAAHFSTLAHALSGRSSVYEPTELELAFRNRKPAGYFCTDPDFPLERYLTGTMLKHVSSEREILLNPTAPRYREYVQFAYENADHLDSLYMAFDMAQRAERSRKISFAQASPEAQKMLHTPKLWDYMEELPDTVDQFAHCRELTDDLARHAK